MEVSHDVSAALVKSALRDILFMYRDMVTNYQGFGHNIDTGDFDPFTLSRAYINGPSWFTADDMDLLYNGCGIKILCMLGDYWDECGPNEVVTLPFVAQVRAWIADGAEFLPPELKDAIACSLDSEPPIDKLESVYRSHVVGTFERLAKEG